MKKSAKWEDVKAKGEAIVAAGGVEIVNENSSEIEAYVMSGDVEGEFPVFDGGPYHVILSKRSWDNKPNVGGWIQGYLCDCVWGSYNSGEPGPRYQGRFCSHAYATLLVANARARNEFMNDRTASASRGEEQNDFGFRWTPCKLSDGTYVASYHGKRATLFKAPAPTYDLDTCIDEMRCAILKAYIDVESEMDWELMMSDDTDESYDTVELDADMVKEAAGLRYDDDWGWVTPYVLYQCDESMPWFGMSYPDALDNGFTFDAYDYRFADRIDANDKLVNDFSFGHPEFFKSDESMMRAFIWGTIKGNERPSFAGKHMPCDSDILEFDTGFYYVYDNDLLQIDVGVRGKMVANNKNARVYIDLDDMNRGINEYWMPLEGPAHNDLSIMYLDGKWQWVVFDYNDEVIDFSSAEFDNAYDALDDFVIYVNFYNPTLYMQKVALNPDIPAFPEFAKQSIGVWATGLSDDECLYIDKWADGRYSGWGCEYINLARPSKGGFLFYDEPTLEDAIAKAVEMIESDEVFTIMAKKTAGDYFDGRISLSFDDMVEMVDDAGWKSYLMLLPDDIGGNVFEILPLNGGWAWQVFDGNDDCVWDSDDVYPSPRAALDDFEDSLNWNNGTLYASKKTAFSKSEIERVYKKILGKIPLTIEERQLIAMVCIDYIETARFLEAGKKEPRTAFMDTRSEFEDILDEYITEKPQIAHHDSAAIWQFMLWAMRRGYIRESSKKNAYNTDFAAISKMVEYGIDLKNNQFKNWRSLVDIQNDEDVQYYQFGLGMTDEDWQEGCRRIWEEISSVASVPKKTSAVWVGNNSNGYDVWSLIGTDDGWTADVVEIYQNEWSYEIYDSEGYFITDGVAETEAEAKQWAEVLVRGHGIGCIDDGASITIASKCADLDDQFAYLADDFYEEYKYHTFDDLATLEATLYDWMDRNGYSAMPYEKTDIVFDLVLSAFDFASKMMFKPKHEGFKTADWYDDLSDDEKQWMHEQEQLDKLRVDYERELAWEREQLDDDEDDDDWYREEGEYVYRFGKKTADKDISKCFYSFDNKLDKGTLVDMYVDYWWQGEFDVFNGTYRVIDSEGSSWRDSDGCRNEHIKYLLENVETGETNWYDNGMGMRSLKWHTASAYSKSRMASMKGAVHWEDVHRHLLESNGFEDEHDDNYVYLYSKNVDGHVLEIACESVVGYGDVFFLNGVDGVWSPDFDSLQDCLEDAFSYIASIRTSSKHASVKNATRTFTYAEMQELEDEVIDKPWLNNADRLKNPDLLIEF